MKRVLALHGNLGSPGDWENLGIPGLEAVDLWDHSEKGFEEMARWLARRAGDERPVLAGYSLGGRLALHAIALHPDMWSGAVIVSAHPGLQSEAERTDRRARDGEWSRWARELPWIEFLRRWDSQGVLGGTAPEGRKALDPFRHSVAAAFENWSLGRQEDLRPALRDCRVPVSWLTGERDRKFTALGEEMASVLPRCRHEVVPGAGHRLLHEVASPVARSVLAMTAG